MDEQFLREYETLCQKYKKGLCGVVCFKSPWVNEIFNINYNEETNRVIMDDLTIDEYFKEENRYE